MVRRLASLSLLLLLAVPALGAAEGPLARVVPGQVLRVLLQENAGTGYEWSLTSSAQGPVVRFRDQGLERFSPPMPGSPQFRVFEFEGCGEGVQTLGFELRRAWESGEPPARAFPVRVQGAKPTSATEVLPRVYRVHPQTRFALELPDEARGFAWMAPTSSQASAVQVLERKGNLLGLQAGAGGTADVTVDELPGSGPATEARRTLFATVVVAP